MQHLGVVGREIRTSNNAECTTSEKTIKKDLDRPSWLPGPDPSPVARRQASP